MHSKDFRSTKLVNFSHAASVIFQGRNNCGSYINNIYRLDSAKKTLLGNIHKKRCMFFPHGQTERIKTHLVDPSPISGRNEYFFTKCAHRFKILSSVPIITAGLTTVAYRSLVLIRHLSTETSTGNNHNKDNMWWYKI